MPDYTCTFENARVLEARRSELEALIEKMFARRHHNRVSAGPSGQMWLTVELVQALRRTSSVYRELSTKTTGPLPFEIGFLRIRDGNLEPISDPLPMDQPEVFVRVISEFLQSGATIHLAHQGEAQQNSREEDTLEEDSPEEATLEEATWRVKEPGVVEAL